jgi:putative membrane protein
MTYLPIANTFSVPIEARIMTGFLLRAAIVALGLWLATWILDGLHFDGPGVLLAAALLLGIVNAIVRPIAIVLTLPLTLLTLGLFLLVVNAAMLGLVALVLGGFQIDGFWTAVGASLIVSVTSWIASGLIGDNGKVEVMSSKRR